MFLLYLYYGCMLFIAIVANLGHLINRLILAA